MTGASERPSRSSLETRKASGSKLRETHRDQRDLRSGIGKAEQALVAAEMALLVATQRVARRRALAAIDAAFAARHGDRRAAIQARYAGLRAALEPGQDAAARTAVLMRLVADEAAELAVLALEMAAERARAKRMVSVALLMQSRSARRQLRRCRRHRAVVRAVGRSQSGSKPVTAGRHWAFRVRRP